MKFLHIVCEVTKETDHKGNPTRILTQIHVINLEDLLSVLWIDECICKFAFKNSKKIVGKPKYSENCDDFIEFLHDDRKVCCFELSVLDLS